MDNLPQDGTAQLGVLPEDTDKNGGTDNGTRSNRRKCKHQSFKIRISYLPICSAALSVRLHIVLIS
mgnify:CR=1 FL=1